MSHCHHCNMKRIIRDNDTNPFHIRLEQLKRKSSSTVESTIKSERLVIGFYKEVQWDSLFKATSLWHYTPTQMLWGDTLVSLNNVTCLVAAITQGLGLGFDGLMFSWHCQISFFHWMTVFGLILIIISRSGGGPTSRFILVTQAY